MSEPRLSLVGCLFEFLIQMTAKILQHFRSLSSDRLTVLETSQQGCDRYDFTWCAAGENGDWVGRGVILDDGCSHYCLSVLADVDAAGAVQEDWNALFQSFGVSSY